MEDDFSRSGESPRAACDDLIGTSLLASTSGDSPRILLWRYCCTRLSKEPIETDCFRHAADEIRHARMSLTNENCGSVLVEHTFLSSLQLFRAGQGSNDHWRPRSVAPLKHCINCDQSKSPSVWFPRVTRPLVPKQNLFRGFCPVFSSKPNLSFSSEHRGSL